MTHQFQIKLQNQAEEEIRIKCRKINEIKCKRLRSLSEPVHQELGSF